MLNAVTGHRLFYGKKRQRLIAVSPDDDARHQSSIHEKEDLFSHLHVNVADEGFDLYDGLARYFDDVVEIEGTKKRMEVSLVDLPPLLQIQLQVCLRSFKGLYILDAGGIILSSVHATASAIQPGDTASVQVPGVREVRGDGLHGSVPRQREP